MSERKPAPGRVVVSHSLAPYAESRVCPWYMGTPDIGRLHDALREHLRTEHADLWRECWGCDGAGLWADVFAALDRECTLCHGRGYIETERSDQ